MYRNGIWSAILGFLLWSVPGWVMMTSTALLVAILPSELPRWVRFLENGLASVAVGLAGLAAYRLTDKVLHHRTHSILCWLSACVAILYQAQWLPPLLIFTGGLVTVAGSVAIKENGNWNWNWSWTWNRRGMGAGAGASADAGASSSSMVGEEPDAITVEVPGRSSPATAATNTATNMTTTTSRRPVRGIVPARTSLDPATTQALVGGIADALEVTTRHHVEHHHQHQRPVDSTTVPAQPKPTQKPPVLLLPSASAQPQPPIEASEESLAVAGEDRSLLSSFPQFPSPYESDMHANYFCTVRQGAGILIGVVVTLVVCFVVRATVPKTSPYLPIHIFAVFFITGTIIFGGGPVVIPLLYSYVVDPGWVTDSEFVLGLTVISIIPGPNFNFGAYCGGLAMRHFVSSPSMATTTTMTTTTMDSAGWTAAEIIFGSVVGFVGIFLPGLAVKTGVLPLWKSVQKHPMIKIALDGVSAAAIGLVWSAVYLLAKNSVRPVGGGVGGGNSGGSGDGGVEVAQRNAGLLGDPVYVVISMTTFVGLAFLKWPPFVMILLGAAVSMVYYGFYVISI